MCDTKVAIQVDAEKMHLIMSSPQTLFIER